MILKVCDTCGKERPLWKARTKTAPSACKPCASKQPKAKPLQPRTPIKKVSAKQKVVLASYRLIRARVLLNCPYCEAQLEGCTGVATEIHHSKGHLGGNMLDSTTFKALCHNCHVWVEENPIAAKQLGLSKDRL